MTTLRRVLIAGGGTGGHLYPGLAVAHELRRRDDETEVFFVGTKRGLEARVIPGEGFRLELLPVRGMPRKGPGQTGAWFAFFRSVVKTLGICIRRRPDVILGTGGYVSAPAVLVGWLLRIPVVLQEQNAVPGAVNRSLSRFAREVHLNFAGARRYFERRDHLRLTGNPLREELFSANRTEAFRRFDLDPGRRTVLVLGGSRGARSINRAVVDAIGRIPNDRHYQFLIQCGTDDLDEVTKGVARSGLPCRVEPYLPDIDDAYAIADLVVCRAGAMTLSEITACGLPAILVPYPHATDDHQTRNAEEIVDRGAALLVSDEELEGERLARELDKLLSDGGRLRRMAASAHGSARYGGAATVADALAALVHPPRGGDLDEGDDDEAEALLAEERAEQARSGRDRSDGDGGRGSRAGRGTGGRDGRGRGGDRGDRGGRGASERGGRSSSDRGGRSSSERGGRSSSERSGRGTSERGGRRGGRGRAERSRGGGGRQDRTRGEATRNDAPAGDTARGDVPRGRAPDPGSAGHDERGGRGRGPDPGGRDRERTPKETGGRSTPAGDAGTGRDGGSGGDGRKRARRRRGRRRGPGGSGKGASAPSPGTD